MPIKVGRAAGRALQLPAPVAISAPDRIRAADTQRADHPHRRQEEPEQGRPVLALQDADDRQHAIGDENSAGGQAQGQLDVVNVPHAERAETGQGQHQAGGRQAHRLDRQLSLAAPVDVLQMQDQRELIQHERHAGTDRYRGERAPAELVRAADRGQGPDDEQDDARDRVMNMRPAGRHIVPERTAAVPDQARDQPGQHKGDDESQEAQHQGQLARRGHVAVPPGTHAATLGARPGREGCGAGRPPGRSRKALTGQFFAGDRRGCGPALAASATLAVLSSPGAAACRDESGDRAGADRPPEPFVDDLVLALKGLPLVR